MLEIARFELVVFVCGLAILVVYKMLTGEINTARMLDDKPGGNQRGEFTATRLQLLIVTVLFAGDLLVQVISQSQFPAIPQELLLALACSHGLYLVNKSIAGARKGP